MAISWLFVMNVSILVASNIDWSQYDANYLWLFLRSFLPLCKIAIVGRYVLPRKKKHYPFFVIESLTSVIYHWPRKSHKIDEEIPFRRIVRSPVVRCTFEKLRVITATKKTANVLYYIMHMEILVTIQFHNITRFNK